MGQTNRLAGKPIEGMYPPMTPSSARTAAEKGHVQLRVPHSITPGVLPATQTELKEIGIVKALLRRYIAIVKKNLADSIPKVIMMFMVSPLTSTLQSECISQLYKED